MQFSKIVAGTMTWGSWGKNLDTAEMSRRIQHCLEIGITSFDHADIYGAYTTEAEFGTAFSASGISRDKVQFISKCGIQYLAPSRENRIKHYDLSGKYIKWSVEQSLKNLQTDYLDLLLLHRPSPLMDADDIALAVLQLKQEGKIRNFGVSNFTPSQTSLIHQRTPVGFNQIQFSLTHFESLFNGDLDYMQTEGIRPMAWSPLGKVFNNQGDQAERIQTVLAQLAKKYDAAEDQILLAWILKHPAGILPVIGTTDMERMQKSVQALDLKLHTEDWFELLVASQGHKVP